MCSDVFRPFGRPVYWFGHPDFGATKNTFQVFFFQLHFNKKHVEVVINEFPMHLIISNWLRIQKCRQRKTVRQKQVEPKKETVNEGVYIHLTT